MAAAAAGGGRLQYCAVVCRCDVELCGIIRGGRVESRGSSLLFRRNVIPVISLPVVILCSIFFAF